MFSRPRGDVRSPSQGRVFEPNQDGLCPDSSESGIKTLEKETNSIERIQTSWCLILTGRLLAHKEHFKIVGL